ncbi:CHAT domain-containing protein [[Leptolyngbya] sp. PCC 7376]|uniref:CHAT domain-containing protein n=1 Tax=[Leptolyngbya] sp. PCC 7376 TaxID=111781 RepID=UPI001CED1CAF
MLLNNTNSIISPYWSIEDEATTILIHSFYKELSKGNLTFAESLRNAQISLLNNSDFSHPYYWGGFRIEI